MDAVRIDELDTPCLTVDLEVFEYNVRLCMNRLVGVRDHNRARESALELIECFDCE